MPSKKNRFGKEELLKFEEENQTRSEKFKFSEENSSQMSGIQKHHRTTEDKKMDSILEKIERRFFCGTNTALKVFRCFDPNNSG